MATICVSVNLDRRMRTSWLRVAILPEDSPYTLSTFQGSLHEKQISGFEAIHDMANAVVGAKMAVIVSPIYQVLTHSPSWSFFVT